MSNSALNAVKQATTLVPNTSEPVTYITKIVKYILFMLKIDFLVIWEFERDHILFRSFFT